MSWTKEYNKGQKRVGELWKASPGRPDATNAITWADDNIWSGIVWIKEIIASLPWTKETIASLSWTKEIIASLPWTKGTVPSEEWTKET